MPAESGDDMRRICHFINMAILVLFASCIILLFGGIEYRAADLMQSIDYQEAPYPVDEYEEEFNPRSDSYSLPDSLFQEANHPEVVYL